MADKRTKHLEIPLTGKLYTCEPAAIGTNFRTLTNMRYTDTHPKGVAGMTKINVTAVTTCIKTRNAFHFVKSQPAESHLLAQMWDTGMTASRVMENTAIIPATGAFSATELWTDTTAAGIGRFSDAPDGQIIYANGIDTCIWGGNETKCGAVLVVTTALTTTGSTFAGCIDVTDRVDNLKSETEYVDYFTVTGNYKTFLVGTPRPSKGITIYFADVNTTANTLVVKGSTTGDWLTITVTSDGTRTGGTTSFAQNGTISWASTVNTITPRYIAGYYLYWYQLTIDDGTTDIYHITMDLPFQPIIDIWDGVYRDITRFYKFTTTRLDNTLNVLEDDYDSASAYTYSDLSSMGAYSAPNNALEIGFTERQVGLVFDIPPDYTNSTGATTMAVDRWTGSQYVAINGIIDGTSEGAISLAKPGVVSWNANESASVTARSIDNGPPLFYYRVRFDKAMDASVRLNYIGGISAPGPISHFKFPVFAQGRVLLCVDRAGDKNMARVSSQYMPQVYSGADSVDLYYGNEEELNCGTELFSQFGSSLYSLILMFKDNEMWVTAGQDIDAWATNTFLLSNTIGCPAPLTLKTINLAVEPGAGVNRALAIWQGADGVYMSDGRAPIPIHGDIKEYFDRQDSRCINASKVGDSMGWVDAEKQEYHLCVASGTAATTLNTELVYDIHRNRWFEIDRTVDLQCGVLVHDTNGNSYNYGFLDTGYMERLEYGTDFDGNDIVHTMQTGDFAPAGLSYETLISKIKLLTVAKTTTTSNITCTHYGDTFSTGTDKTMSPVKANYRVAMPGWEDKLSGDPFHSLKFTITTNDEATGFEPLAVVVAYHPTHQE